jgi:hypothetical protein
MSSPISISAEQGNWLLQQISGFELPEKLGEVKFDGSTRSEVKDNCRMTIRALRHHSYYASLVGPDHRLVFGAEENWLKNKDGALEMQTPGRQYVVDLEEDGVNGLMWLFYALLTPSIRKEDGSFIHRSIAPLTAEIFIWPVVEQLSKVQALRAALGLNGVKNKSRWSDDPKPITQ